MADRTHIEWTDATWNPITGCGVVSPGCTNCYAMRLAGTRMKHHWSRKDLTTMTKAGPVWNGQVRFNEEWIEQPLRWKKPRRIFVCAHGDLFHEGVPDEWIDKVFAVMALASQHTFQCLTKRADRMRAYCSDPGVTQRVAQAMDAILVDQEHDPVERWAAIPGFEEYETSTHGQVRRNGLILKQIPNPLSSRPTVTLWRGNEPTTFFVHTLVLNAHHGPMIEGTEARHRNGNRQDNRVANLEWATGSINQADKVRHGSNGGPAKINREMAAEIRALRKSGRTQQSLADQFGVSRPLISMIESRKVWPDALEWPLPNCWLGVSVEDRPHKSRIAFLRETPAAKRFLSIEPLLEDLGELDLEGIDWIIAGGESGPGARPIHPNWVRSIRDQCAAAEVPFFFKQWGEWVTENQSPENIILPGESRIPWGGPAHPRTGWPSGDQTSVFKVGKKAAGALLDGHEHREFPR